MQISIAPVLIIHPSAIKYKKQNNMPTQTVEDNDDAPAEVVEAQRIFSGLSPGVNISKSAI